MIAVFLANGFEEIEALTTVDILRRAGLSVVTVGVGGKTVTGAHGITVETDRTDVPETLEAVVLPGGMPGTLHLERSKTVQDCLSREAAKGTLICAICAAPSVLGHKGLLNGKKATCFPGFENELIGATVTGASVEEDGGIITAKGAGVTVEFALRIVAALCSKQEAEKIRDGIQCR